MILFLMLALGFAVGHFFYPLVLKVSVALGYVDHPDGERKQQERSIPYGGGVVMLASWMTWGLLVMIGEVLGLWGVIWGESLLMSMLVFSPSSFAVAFGLCAMFGLGLADDVMVLSPKIKLMVQLLIATVVVVFGDLSMSFFSEHEWLGMVGTVFWLVLITNAFNLIDNMDGYCVSVAAVTMFFHALSQMMTGHHLVAMATWMALGPLLAFGVKNLPPARMYLGDAGSLSLGFFMGLLSVSSTYYHEGQSSASVFLPLVMMGVPLFDVVTVMLRRYQLGKPLMEADRRHFSHRLLNLGFCVRDVLWIIAGLATMVGLSSLLLLRVEELMGWCLLLQLLLLFTLVVVFEARARRHLKA